MLIELRIRDFAVIDDLTLTLGPGLNVLSGETGAGKSIVVDALSLLLGERASSDDVRAGAARATVEGVFDVSARPEVEEALDALGFQAEDGLLILRREVQAEGRNRAWINGSPATATAVGEVGQRLVDLHGQHEHQTLLRPAAQRDLLDAFADAEELAREVRVAHQGLARATAALEERQTHLRELEAQGDFLRFQLDEIRAAEVQAGEEEELEAEARRLENAQELARETHRIHEALYGDEGALSDRLASARQAVQRLVRLDPELEALAELLETALHTTQEAGRWAGAYAEGVEHDPARLRRLQERRDLLFRLKRKYGPDLADVVETEARLAREVAELDRGESDLSALEDQVAQARDRLQGMARELSRAREAAAGVLAQEVQALFPRLGMAGGQVEIALRPLESPGSGGAESVEFLVSLNPGFPPRPLARVASGGELSRVMLALKTVLARVDRVPTLVFDEIDAGVGGAVAHGVAETLAQVADHHQVFVITHLAQLASRGRAHLRVEKHQVEGRAVTRVTPLTGQARIEEIARMLGGDPDSEVSLEHARSLLG